MAPTSRAYHSPRREQDAQRTHEHILASARELFVVRGYAKVTMSDVAASAGIAVKTVYASVGTKSAILQTLIASDMADGELAEAAAKVEQAGALDAAIDLLARYSRADTERLQPLIDLLHASMAGDEGARRAWERIVKAYQLAFTQVAELLVARGLVAGHLERSGVTDRLWFALGPSAWRTLVVECHWSYDDAERFLRRQATFTLKKGGDG